MRRGWQFDVELFKRRWPLFAVGIEDDEFILRLWVVEITVWRY
jgi:hypothetical protein